MPTNLFIESAYSFSGSLLKLQDIIDYAKTHDEDHVVLTDKNSHGFYKFYHLATKHDLKPVIGLQVKLEPLYKNETLNLVCYAQNQQGYQNLLKLASLQSIHKVLAFDGFKEHIQGTSIVIDSTTGEWRELDQEGLSKALEVWVEMLRKSNSNVYLGIDKQSQTLPFKMPKVELVKTVMHSESDIATYQTLCKVLQSKPYVRPMALTSKNSNKNAENLKFLKAHGLTLTFKKATLPRFKTPNDIDTKRYLMALSQKGLSRRIENQKVDIETYQSRLQKELKTIDDLGFNDYFLIIWDVVKYAKQNNILVGPGRGSAPGSLVAYALGITAIDPIANGLLFERFLNKARKTMPDIDIDFPDHKRDQVIKYLKDKYGSKYVALICTFGTFLSKSALRDTARVLDIEAKYIDEILRKMKPYTDISTMIDNDADVKNRIKNDDNIKRWLYSAKNIESLPRHVSTHAAGVILSEKPLIEYTAIQEGLNTLYQTQYEQSDLEDMGLLKMDILGLRNLSMIETTIERIYEVYNRKIDVSKIPLNDRKTFSFLREKSTTGLFQLESSGMRTLIKRLKIQSFDDIVTVLALYRPGPMEQIPVFLKRRQKQQSIQPIAKTVDKILAPTQGILLYQEQIMAIAVQFANYTLVEADLLRRAISKKDGEVLKAERKHFVDSAKKAGKSHELANKIYDYIVKFADYGFNKSHSVAYAMIAYWMAYLKANYPAVFLSVLMQNALNNDRLMRLYMQELHEHGLVLQKPSVKHSSEVFTLSKNALYYPLNGIKYLGKQTIVAYLDIKNNISFKSFVSFVKDTKGVFNKRHYEMLIKSGACDEFGINRNKMLNNLEPLLDFLEYEKSLALEEFIFQDYKEFNQETLRQVEYQAIGFNIAYDRFKDFEVLMKDEKMSWPNMILTMPNNRFVHLGGLLGAVKEITTKQGKKMAFLTLEDRITSVEVVCFPDVYEGLDFSLKKDGFYKISGKIQIKEDKHQLIANSVKRLHV